MKPAPLPFDEKERLKTLRDYGVLDTPDEAHFDEITKTAALICDCKISLVSLVDENRQWFKSKYGLQAIETPRDVSYCGHTIMQDDLLIIEDAEKDERFCDNPLFLNEPHVRFYAGAPLITPSGHRIGSLCVIDLISKTLSEDKKLLLKILAKQVVNYLEIKKSKELAERKLREIEFYRTGLDAHTIISRMNKEGELTCVNQKFCEISKYTAKELLGKHYSILKSGTHSDEFFSQFWKTFSQGEVWKGEMRNKAKDGSLYWVDATFIPIKDDAGVVTEYMGLSYDITTKKEIILLNSETQRMTKIGGWELNAVTMETKWTEETYRIHEIEPGTPTYAEKGIQFYAEHERPRITKYVKDCLEKGEPYESEFEFITAKGNHRWVLAKGLPEFNEDGKVIRIIGTFQDITEQKLLEKKLRDSNDYLDLALEGAGLGIWDWNLKNNAVKFDRRWAEMLGLNINEIEMNLSTWESRVHPDDLAKCYNDLKAYLDGKTSYYENVHRMRHAEGHWVHILDRGRISEWDANGNPIRFNGTHFNITDARERERELDLILETHKIGIWRFNPLSNELIWDQSMYTLFGVDPVGSMETYDLWVNSLHPSYAKDVMNKFESSLKNNNDYFEAIFKVVTQDGTNQVKDIGARAIIERDQQGQAIFVTGVNWDRTKEQEAVDEAQKQMKIAQHQARLASIGQLAAGVGHEINNPLAIIKGYIALVERRLEEGVSPGSDLGSYIKKINQATDRIANIVKGLRTFSRSDSSETKEFNPVAAIEESFNLVHEIYEKEGIKLKFINEAQTSDFVLKGSRGKFQQILMNLLSNAKDAVKKNEDKQIEIFLHLLHSKMQLKVKDNGHGIKDEIKEKIFDPFFTTKDVNEGAGIGLSLVHNFVKELHGTLDVLSKPQQETIFTIELPVLLKMEQKENPDRPESKEKFDAKVLVVDDEEGIRESLAILLEESGMEVITAENGKEAYDLLIQNPERFDLVISDIKMPVMDGILFLKALRSDLRIRQPKFLLMAGDININFEDETSELQKLIQGHLFKPFDEEKIMKILSVLFKLEKNHESA